MKGLRDIRRLLERPGEEVHCLDLADRSEESFGGDAALDAPARAALKARIRDLQEETCRGGGPNDIGRADRLRGEFDQLVEALSGALGLGGRARRLGSLAERARSSVTWRIRHAVRKLGAAQPRARAAPGEQPAHRHLLRLRARATGRLALRQLSSADDGRQP